MLSFLLYQNAIVYAQPLKQRCSSTYHRAALLLERADRCNCAGMYFAGPPSTAVSRPGLPPAKETTVWVGKISATVDDSLIRSLLEACGTIKSWKPMKDPDSGKSKGFGFCEFEDAEGVLRAIRLLNHLPLDGQEILLKCNTATQK